MMGRILEAMMNIRLVFDAKKILPSTKFESYFFLILMRYVNFFHCILKEMSMARSSLGVFILLSGSGCSDRIWIPVLTAPATSRAGVGIPKVCAYRLEMPCKECNQLTKKYHNTLMKKVGSGRNIQIKNISKIFS